MCATPVGSAVSITTPPIAIQNSKLARIEMAALCATSVQEQMLYDGWLLRWSASSGKRMRSINVVAKPSLPLQERLQECAALYKQHGLPMVFRLTSLCPEDGLSTQLQSLGFERSGETRVMARTLNRNCAIAHTACIEVVDVEKFVQVLGEIRCATQAQRKEHEHRLKNLKVNVRAVLLKDSQHGYIAAGLAILDGTLLGLFDIATAVEHRRSGHARALVSSLLAYGVERGATDAYLQVELSNHAARTLYESDGFTDCYEYCYYSSSNFNPAETEYK